MFDYDDFVRGLINIIITLFFILAMAMAIILQLLFLKV